MSKKESKSYGSIERAGKHLSKSGEIITAEDFVDEQAGRELRRADLPLWQRVAYDCRKLWQKLFS